MLGRRVATTEPSKHTEKREKFMVVLEVFHAANFTGMASGGGYISASVEQMFIMQHL